MGDSNRSYRSLLSCLFLLLCSFLFLASATRPNPNRSDQAALSVIIRDLGINGQCLLTSPCKIPGVFYESKLSDDNNQILRITRLAFKNQRLTGFISPAIGRLSELRELSLPNNLLVNAVPPQIVDLKKLEILDLRNNRFSGRIPSNLSSLTSLRVLDLSLNRFSGNLRFLKRFPNLESLSVANNLFSGKVPETLSLFHKLRFSDFSGNSFLEGPTPVMNRIQSLGATRHILAETLTLNSTKHSNQTSSESGADKKGKSNKKKKTTAWILGFFLGAIVGTIAGVVISILFRIIMKAIRGGDKQSGPSIFSPMIKKAKDLAFLDEEDGLASFEVIGRGGCGEVYKAELPGSNGKIIAIKKVIQTQKDGMDLEKEETKFLNKKTRQIRSEINTVGHIRHRNLLPLLAHVPRPDCHYLVYEFMKNGSLQDILNDVAEGKRELPWATRHRIALGVASGLEYLHMNHSPMIIHRDLKPGNVLLDDEMEARIADFGLAMSVPDANTHVTASNVAGTVGYIAPEYHQTLKFTDKCDIYSFGVLLGVLVIGKLPSDEFFQNTDEMSLIKWMRNVMTSENPNRAIDQKLVEQGNDEQILLALKIACFCTLDDPKQRPNSKEVRTMLSQIKQ